MVSESRLPDMICPSTDKFWARDISQSTGCIIHSLVVGKSMVKILSMKKLGKCTKFFLSLSIMIENIGKILLWFSFGGERDGGEYCRAGSTPSRV